MELPSLLSVVFVATFLAIVAFVAVKKRAPTLFDIQYFLYTRTPFGPWYHNRQLSETRGKAAHVNVRPEDHTLLPTGSASPVFRVIPIPHLQDNYAYMIVHTASQTAVVVDAADPVRVAGAVKQLGVKLVALLTTHRHMDHSGGNLPLKALFNTLMIFGNKVDSVPGTTHDVSDGQVLGVGPFSFLVIATPAHTHGHVAYALLDEAKTPMALFSGDALFVTGTGRVFEGSHETMLRSLHHILAVVPDTCIVFPGHEYAFVNTTWALRVDPHNANLQALHERTKTCKRMGIPLTPTTILEEKLCSPFFRVHLPPYSSDSSFASQVEAFTQLRKSKDVFKM